MSLNVVGGRFFVGIDWASAVHAVCVQDATGRQVSAFTVEHSADGLAGLMRRLARLGEPAEMPVGIERPDGRLVDALLEACFPKAKTGIHELRSETRRANMIARAVMGPRTK